MIRLETAKPLFVSSDSNSYSTTVHEEIDTPVSRRRYLGTIWYWEGQKSFTASVNTIDSDGLSSRHPIHLTDSLPRGVKSIIEFHELTDYQYAPWPKEEDEGEE